MVGTKKPIDIREVKLRNFNKDIYLPFENYYACEILPQDWIDIIPSMNNRTISKFNSTLYD
jgi:hypothetical protein